LFAVDRGNLDLWILPFCGFTLLALYRGFSVLGSISLAIAIAIKGYPALLVLVFFVHRRYWSGILSVTLAVLLSVVSLCLFQNGLDVNWVGLKIGLANFKSYYVIGNGSTHYSADFHNAIKIMDTLVGPVFSFPVGEVLAIWFTRVFSFPLLVISVAYFVLVRRLFHRRLTVLFLAMIAYPNVINDYKLTLLLIPLFCLVISDEEWGVRDRTAAGFMICLLIPKNYYFIYSDVSISCLLSPVFFMIVWMVYVCDRSVWPKTRIELGKRLESYKIPIWRKV
jgi:hypothetical protein